MVGGAPLACMEKKECGRLCGWEVQSRLRGAGPSPAELVQIAGNGCQILRKAARGSGFSQKADG